MPGIDKPLRVIVVTWWTIVNILLLLSWTIMLGIPGLFTIGYRPLAVIASQEIWMYVVIVLLISSIVAATSWPKLTLVSLLASATLWSFIGIIALLAQPHGLVWQFIWIVAFFVAKEYIYVAKRLRIYYKIKG